MRGEEQEAVTFNQTDQADVVVIVFFFFFFHDSKP
jgi:hypothetical protein